MKQPHERALVRAMRVVRHFRSTTCSSGRAEAGQAIFEYALVLALFSIAAMAGLTLLGNSTSKVLTRFQTNLTAYNLRHA